MLSGNTRRERLEVMLVCKHSAVRNHKLSHADKVSMVSRCRETEEKLETDMCLEPRQAISLSKLDFKMKMRCGRYSSADGLNCGVGEVHKFFLHVV